MAQTLNKGELSIAPGTVLSTVDELQNASNATLVNDGDLYLYGDFRNDGQVGFTPGVVTGATYLNGMGVQRITGEAPMEWNHVVFDNNTGSQPAFLLDSYVQIYGVATFDKGIIDTDKHGGLIVFENGSGHLNASRESYVQGEVRKVGNEAFLYPSGYNGMYSPMEISAPSNEKDSFTGRYYLENSNGQYPHSNKAGEILDIDDAEYWKIEKTSGVSDVFLTLTWNEEVTPRAIYQAPYEEISIVHWDDAQNRWIDIGGAADPNTKQVSMIADPLKAYGVFTLARVKRVDDPACGGKKIVVYNAVSPNEDGINDYFNVAGIEGCASSSVQIYNRWGVKVYETSAYNTSGNVFRGFSEGRATVNRGEKLPDGTYFYILDYVNDNGKKVNKAGYLYISQ
ncbi:gliding motility-associated C-terminal domain-containing protein [Flavobacterium sp. LAR06]|uniref:gliding motility-associated C-terminal domain-containing protein n=1 Tax=Flavobacterium sp. LAR06 TaxID=3064897 RepID=UPI0035C06F4C